MSQRHGRKLAMPLVALVVTSSAIAAFADEATGKLVWVDEKNSSLLLECPEKGCPTIPNAKAGETYTFVIPANLRAEVAALKEGDIVKVTYDDGKEKGYVITAVGK